jgi:hypothetical protein
LRLSSRAAQLAGIKGKRPANALDVVEQPYLAADELWLDGIDWRRNLREWRIPILRDCSDLIMLLFRGSS